MNFMGGPILLYHPNLDPNTNETTYQSELATYASLSAQLESNWKTIASQYNINSNDSQRYLQVFQKELAALKTKIEATHQYFQTASQYVGKNPNDIGKCINELGL
jgi:alpha-ketoglutarate-dependent taurine dioxygenase